MKYLYNLQIQKSDGSMWTAQVLAMDTTASGVTTPAAINAQTWGFGQAGAGSVLLGCNRLGQIDHDTTA